MEFQVSVGPTHPNSSFTLLTDLKISLILTTRNNHIEIFVPGKILTFIQQMDINHLVRAGTVLGTRDTEVAQRILSTYNMHSFLDP